MAAPRFLRILPILIAWHDAERNPLARPRDDEHPPVSRGERVGA
jgi:hypothetical protein